MKTNKSQGVQTPVAVEVLRYKQKRKINQEVVLLCIFAAEWFQTEDMAYTDEFRRKRCLDTLREILGGPEKPGYLQERMNEKMDGVLDRLCADFEDLRPRDILIFCYAAAGLTSDLSARLAGLSGPGAARVIKSRLRERILLSDSPYAQEYLALLPKKGCRIGEEMLYLHNLKFKKKWKL